MRHVEVELMVKERWRPRGESRGSLIDMRTEQCQVMIEGAIIEGTQFTPYSGGIPHNAA
jgi:hypothetical protein